MFYSIHYEIIQDPLSVLRLNTMNLVWGYESGSELCIFDQYLSFSIPSLVSVLHHIRDCAYTYTSKLKLMLTKIFLEIIQVSLKIITIYI